MCGFGFPAGYNRRDVPALLFPQETLLSRICLFRIFHAENCWLGLAKGIQNWVYWVETKPEKLSTLEISKIQIAQELIFTRLIKRFDLGSDFAYSSNSYAVQPGFNIFHHYYILKDAYKDSHFSTVDMCSRCAWSTIQYLHSLILEGTHWNHFDGFVQRI